MMPVRLLELAKREAHRAARWYEKRQKGLGRRLLHALHATLLAIEKSPELFPHLETIPEGIDIRRAILKRFPYVVVFEMKGTEIVVLAIAHKSRRPNYWARRRD